MKVGTERKRAKRCRGKNQLKEKEKHKREKVNTRSNVMRNSKNPPFKIWRETGNDKPRRTASRLGEKTWLEKVSSSLPYRRKA